MVLQWQQAVGSEDHWTVVVHGFDQAQHLATRFFAELARRAAPAHQIDVIVGASHGWSDAALRTLGVEAEAALPLDEFPWHRATYDGIDEGEARRLTQEIAQGSDASLEQEHPKLLAHYRSVGDQLAAARISLRMLAVYGRLGYYHEAKNFLNDALPYFDELVGDDEAARINYVTAVNSCLVMTDDQARALQVIETLAAPRLAKPVSLAAMNYILAMHHLRYAEAKDLGLAELHILRAVENIRIAKNRSDTQEQPFLEAFIDNGLAFLRMRQGRPQEAIALCRSGYESLTSELGDDRHLLHRSVLQYNVAQIHVALGHLEEGLEHFQKAISMDPHYSEYHNESGNILQRMHRFDEAAESYARALDCSPAYPEVYFNKAVCHTRQERWEDALACFATSLDLNPNQPEIFVLRAEMFGQLGRVDEALAEYDSAIALDYEAATARVNRAVLLFNNGSYGLALSDMNHAIALDAGTAAHYENRAAIYQALHQEDLRRRDLAMAERYCGAMPP